MAIWGEEGIQEQLQGSKRNKHVYEKLSSELAKHGIVKNGEQCRGKIKKLRQEYKKLKDNHNLTGRGRKKWKFFESLNDILGNRPAMRPPVVLETFPLLDTQSRGGSRGGSLGSDEPPFSALLITTIKKNTTFRCPRPPRSPSCAFCTPRCPIEVDLCVTRHRYYRSLRLLCRIAR